MDKSKDELIEELKKISSKRIEEIISILSEIHEKEKIIVPNKIDKNSMVCFVLSCPGREEMIYGKPCQGITGSNLNKLLERLHVGCPKLFPFDNKDEYDILNATQIVHFDALDGCTEGLVNEIETEKQNVRDYLANNKNFKLAILLGEKSKLLLELFEGKSIESVHLGFKSINKINKDNAGKDIMKNYSKSSQRTCARIDVIAQEILKQIDDLIRKEILVL